MAKKVNGLNDEEKQYKTAVSGLGSLKTYTSRNGFDKRSYEIYTKHLNKARELEETGNIRGEFKDDLKRVVSDLSEAVGQYNPESVSNETPEKQPVPAQQSAVESKATKKSRAVKKPNETKTPAQKAKRWGRTNEAFDKEFREIQEYTDSIVELGPERIEGAKRRIEILYKMFSITGELPHSKISLEQYGKVEKYKIELDERKAKLEREASEAGAQRPQEPERPQDPIAVLVNEKLIALDNKRNEEIRTAEPGAEGDIINKYEKLKAKTMRSIGIPSTGSTRAASRKTLSEWLWGRWGE